MERVVGRNGGGRRWNAHNLSWKGVHGNPGGWGKRGLLPGPVGALAGEAPGPALLCTNRER